MQYTHTHTIHLEDICVKRLKGNGKNRIIQLSQTHLVTAACNFHIKYKIITDDIGRQVCDFGMKVKQSTYYSFLFNIMIRSSPVCSRKNQHIAVIFSSYSCQAVALNHVHLYERQLQEKESYMVPNITFIFLQDSKGTAVSITRY
jgi:hypothetical protein